MNLHITPSFNIDRLCKTASVLLFLVIHENNETISACPRKQAKQKGYSVCDDVVVFNDSAIDDEHLPTVSRHSQCFYTKKPIHITMKYILTNTD